jgi:hypothetical protein
VPTSTATISQYFSCTTILFPYLSNERPEADYSLRGLRTEMDGLNALPSIDTVSHDGMCICVYVHFTEGSCQGLSTFRTCHQAS